MLTETANTQTDLANMTGSSPAYVNQMMTGKKRPSPEWVELICTTLNLNPEQRQQLHYEAAKAQGFKLDLTKK